MGDEQVTRTSTRIVDVEALDLEMLRAWLNDGYSRSVRTAYLILGDRDDAEDAVQEAYLRAWRFRGSLSAKSNFPAWLYRIVVNTCNSTLRREIPRQRTREGSVELDELAQRRDRLDELDLSSDVARAICDLPVHLRVVIVLRYYADLSERDISVAISRPPGTVKSRLAEARRRLSEHPALSSERPDVATKEQRA